MDILKKLGVVVKRAIYFITIQGRYFGSISLDHPLLPEKLLEREFPNDVEVGDLFNHEQQLA